MGCGASAPADGRKTLMAKPSRRTMVRTGVISGSPAPRAKNPLIAARSRKSGSVVGEEAEELFARVHLVFKKLDKQNRGSISIDEFVRGVLLSPEVWQEFNNDADLPAFFSCGAEQNVMMGNVPTATALTFLPEAVRLAGTVPRDARHVHVSRLCTGDEIARNLREDLEDADWFTVGEKTLSRFNMKRMLGSSRLHLRPEEVNAMICEASKSMAQNGMFDTDSALAACASALAVVEPFNLAQVSEHVASERSLTRSITTAFQKAASRTKARELTMEKVFNILQDAQLGLSRGQLALVVASGVDPETRAAVVAGSADAFSPEFLTVAVVDADLIARIAYSMFGNPSLAVRAAFLNDPSKQTGKFAGRDVAMACDCVANSFPPVDSRKKLPADFQIKATIKALAKALGGGEEEGKTGKIEMDVVCVAMLGMLQSEYSLLEAMPTADMVTRWTRRMLLFASRHNDLHDREPSVSFLDNGKDENEEDPDNQR